MKSMKSANKIDITKETNDKKIKSLGDISMQINNILKKSIKTEKK